MNKQNVDAWIVEEENSVAVLFFEQTPLGVTTIGVTV